MGQWDQHVSAQGMATVAGLYGFGDERGYRQRNFQRDDTYVQFDMSKETKYIIKAIGTTSIHSPVESHQFIVQ